MKGISSVHVRGTTGSGDAPVTLDIVVDATDDCEGSLTVGLASTQLMAFGKKLWLKPDEEFLVAQLGLGADTFSQTRDRWIAYPRSSGFDQICHLGTFLSDFTHEGAKGAAPLVTSDLVNGIAAVKLVSHRKDRAFTTWVAVDTPHHVLKVDVSDQAGGSLLALTFSAFDEPFDVKTPAPADVAHLSGVSD